MTNTNAGNIVEQTEIIISSTPGQLEKIEHMAADISKKANFNEEKSDNLAIVLTELVNNAIRHGNKNDPAKSVFIKTVLTKEYIEISVKDEGDSFDPEEIANPTDPENLWKESGRGIFLVRNLIDEVRFNPSESGMEIIIREYITSGN